MPYISPEVILEAKQIDLLTYLKACEPSQLVRVSGNTYCTKEHDSLKISNGKWMWWSRGIGGKTALDYLIKVQGYSFLEAVQAILGTYKKKKRGRRKRRSCFLKNASRRTRLQSICLGVGLTMKPSTTACGKGFSLSLSRIITPSLSALMRTDKRSTPHTELPMPQGLWATVPAVRSSIRSVSLMETDGICTSLNVPSTCSPMPL